MVHTKNWNHFLRTFQGRFNSLPTRAKINTPNNWQPFLNDQSLFIEDNSNNRAVGNLICLRTYIYVLSRQVTSERTHIYVLGRHWVKNHNRFSRTTYNVQLYQKCNFTECTKCIFPVHANRTLPMK